MLQYIIKQYTLNIELYYNIQFFSKYYVTYFELILTFFSFRSVNTSVNQV